MKTLFVVNRESDWPQELGNAAVATAKAYLTGAGSNKLGDCLEENRWFDPAH